VGRAVSGPAEVTVTRRHDALEGQQLRVLGALRRHGGTELLVVLPDGSKRLIPQAWTDAAADAAGSEAATLGMVSDLLAACMLVRGLCARSARQQEQAARKSPVKEDNHAACPAQSAAGGVSGATRDGVPAVPRTPGHRGGHAAGQPDREGRCPASGRPGRGQR
jgi:hypothetical protein